MAQPERADAPRLSLRLQSRATLVDDLALFGRTVGPRRGLDKRTQAQREDYCIRRWLIALVAADRVALPATLEAPPAGSGYPDYVLRTGPNDVELGVEVTEAGDAIWQTWLTRTESAESPRLWLDNEDGYAGDQPERIVVRDLIEAVARKATKRRDGRYSAIESCDLLIYENSEGGLLCDRDEVLRCLTGEATDSLRADAREFRQIHLLFGDCVYIDLFGVQRLPPIDVSREHADGWSDWLDAQAKYLRARNFNALDLDGLAEELESLGKADQRALRSQLRRLLVHLLKWQYQPELRGTSWQNSIGLARAEIEGLLEENPSFENRYLDFLSKTYPQSVAEAAKETGLLESTFPKSCPYTVDQLRDADFFPEAGDHG